MSFRRALLPLIAVFAAAFSVPAKSASPEGLWLAEDQTWFSSSVQKELRSPRSFLVTHFFNHQTHHRGQAHALITACGENTGDTDLFLLVEPA